MAQAESLTIEKLTFWDINNAPLVIENIALKYLTQEAEVIECRLSFTVDLATYKTIDSLELFNLQPEVRGNSSEINFAPSHPINLEISLKPDLLGTLLANGSDEAAVAYLLNLEQQRLTDTENIVTNQNLLDTESWLCLGVSQAQDIATVGFKTFWYYIDFTAMEQSETKETEIAEGVFNFIKDYAETSLIDVAENATKDIINSVSTAFDEILNESLGELESSFSDDNTLFTEVADFFEAEGWSYIKGTEPNTIKLQYRGKNGQWNCIATTKETEQEFIFYSIYPLTVAQPQYSAIADFIINTNYNLTIGNFDFDYNTGTVRYKTSIRVKGDYLSYEMIANVVKPNIATMDRYLPKILTLVENG